jgi:hypothetical protein
MRNLETLLRPPADFFQKQWKKTGQDFREKSMEFNVE